MPDLPKPRHTRARPGAKTASRNAGCSWIQAKEKAIQQRHEALDQPLLF